MSKLRVQHSTLCCMVDLKQYKNTHICQQRKTNYTKNINIKGLATMKCTKSAHVLKTRRKYNRKHPEESRDNVISK